MGLAFSKGTHLLSRLPIINENLAISASCGKSVPIRRESHTVDKAAVVTNCELELEWRALEERSTVIITPCC